MNVSQIFLCILTITFAGSIACGIVKLYLNLTKNNNPYLLITLIKIAVSLFLFPAAFVGISILYMQYGNGAWIRFGDFLFGTTEMIENVFTVVGVVWAIGCIVRLINLGRQYYRLYLLTRGNIPVENDRWLDMFEEQRQAKGIKRVSVCHNDMLESPIVVGIIKPMVILPYADFGEKELRVFYEHELNHLKSHDLIWRTMGIVITAVHWFNPLAYILFNDLMFYQEVICDCNSTMENIYFSTKEYGMLLAGLNPNKHINVHMTAIGESTNKIIRRIEIMVYTKKLKKINKFIAIGCGMALFMMSVLPTCLITVKAADMQTRWIQDTEVTVEKTESDYGEPVRLELPKDDVPEIVIVSPVQTLTSSFHLDCTIPANTRAIYNIQKMYAGEEVTIAAYCADSRTYRIGIKNSTGTVWYTQGTGTIVNTFEIEADGTYAAFVQNMSDTPMTVTGTAMYP